MAENYILKVTAGPSYDEKTQKPIDVNSSTPLTIDSEHLSARLHVRIQNYRGLPKDSSSSSPYFSHDLHKSDLYSISFAFTPKKNFNGDELVFGNDFDHPIRDRLPYGFSKAFSFVKWWIDPGLYGDPYADEPHLYGPLLSSINVLHIAASGSGKQLEKTAAECGDKIDGANGDADVVVFTEGAHGDGEKVRELEGLPEASAARMKHFLTEQKRKDFQFEEGRSYACDFFNPYLDFNDFSLKLPVITLPIVKHWDGQPLREHSLRYVLKNRTTNDPLIVIVLTLLPIESLEKAEKDSITTAVKSGEDAPATANMAAGGADDDLD